MECFHTYRKVNADPPLPSPPLLTLLNLCSPHKALFSESIQFPEQKSAAAMDRWQHKPGTPHAWYEHPTPMRVSVLIKSDFPRQEKNRKCQAVFSGSQGTTVFPILNAFNPLLSLALVTVNHQMTPERRTHFSSPPLPYIRHCFRLENHDHGYHIAESIYFVLPFLRPTWQEASFRVLCGLENREGRVGG